MGGQSRLQFIQWRESSGVSIPGKGVQRQLESMGLGKFRRFKQPGDGLFAGRLKAVESFRISAQYHAGDIVRALAADFMIPQHAG